MAVDRRDRVGATPGETGLRLEWSHGDAEDGREVKRDGGPRDQGLHPTRIPAAVHSEEKGGVDDRHAVGRRYGRVRGPFRRSVARAA